VVLVEVRLSCIRCLVSVLMRVVICICRCVSIGVFDLFALFVFRCWMRYLVIDLVVLLG